MERALEGLEPQNIQEEPGLPGVPMVSLTQAEVDDLKHKAEVSSQNFERAKKAEAALKDEKELRNNTNNEVSADQGLRDEIESIKTKLAKQEVLEANPMLKDKWKDLEEFRQLEDNRGMNLKTAAKAFLIENGLLETPRQGLESKTGGDRQPVQTGMTIEDAEKLRVSNSKLYKEKLLRGEIPNS